jgi:hypothetical protein
LFIKQEIGWSHRIDPEPLTEGLYKFTLLCCYGAYMTPRRPIGMWEA